MKLEDYIKQCLENSEFKKYWIEDGLPIDFTESLESFSAVYEKLTEVFESKDEYTQKLNALIQNKGIHGPDTKMTVEFYETNGHCPVIEFLASLQDQKLKEKTVKNIYNLATYGLDLNKTDNSSYVGDGIYELRSKQHNNIDRIFYFFVIGNKIIMTNGYIKKAQKLDKVEFKKAKNYRDDYSRHAK